MPVKCVTFDLWLTLIWDSEELEEYRRLRRLVNFQRFAKRYWENGHNGGPRTTNGKLGFNEVRLAIEGMRARVKSLYEQGFDVHPNDRGKMLFDLLGIKVPKEEAEDIYEKAGKVLSDSGYINRYPNLNREAKPTLKSLRETFPGLKIALISNAARSSKTYARMLRSFGIDEYFDELIVSCEVGYLKPRREIFETALNSVSVKPAEALHVGDLFKADVVGAASCGMNACLYTGLWSKYAQYMNPGEHIPGNFEPKPDLIVDEIQRLQDCIKVAEKIR